MIMVLVMVMDGWTESIEGIEGSDAGTGFGSAIVSQTGIGIDTKTRGAIQNTTERSHCRITLV